MNSKTQALAELAVKLTQQKPAHSSHSRIVRDAASLISRANRLTNLAELQCNQELTPRQTRAIANNRKFILDTLAPYKVRAKFTGDPRGFVVKLFFRDKSYNTWGGVEEGWGI